MLGGGHGVAHGERTCRGRGISPGKAHKDIARRGRAVDLRGRGGGARRAGIHRRRGSQRIRSLAPPAARPDGRHPLHRHQSAGRHGRRCARAPCARAASRSAGDLYLGARHSDQSPQSGGRGDVRLQALRSFQSRTAGALPRRHQPHARRRGTFGLRARKSFRRHGSRRASVLRTLALLTMRVVGGRDLLSRREATKKDLILRSIAARAAMRLEGWPPKDWCTLKNQLFIPPRARNSSSQWMW